MQVGSRWGANDPNSAPAQARERQEAAVGLARFDYGIIAEALRTSFCTHYCMMALLIEEVPPRLAQWAESCPCNGCLYEILNPPAADGSDQEPLWASLGYMSCGRQEGPSDGCGQVAGSG